MKKFGFLLCTLAATLAYTHGQSKKDFTLEDVFKNGTFAAKSAGALNIMNDGISYSDLLPQGTSDWKICKIDLETAKDTQVIFSSKDISTKFMPESYEFSEDENLLLLTYQTERIYRHSVRSLAYVIDIKNKSIVQIGNEKIMYPTLSSDNKNVAFVKDNNLFVYNIGSGKETAITHDGEKNKVINGAVDWVYEEEFSMSRGFEWSPDSRFIAYYRFDESGVKEYSMPMYLGLYPTNETWKYPKSGEANSVVDVYVYRLDNASNTKCNTGSENDQYLPRITWTQEPDVLSIQRLNRWQNTWELLFADATNGNTWTILKEQNKAYVDINDNLKFLKDKHSFIYTSEKGGYNQLYHYDYVDKTGTSPKVKEALVTAGNFDVVDVCAIDEKTKTIYYTSSEVSPTEDHLFCIKFNGKDKKRLSVESGNHMISFGKGNKFYTDIYSTINTPFQCYLHKVGKDWKKAVETNDKLKNQLESYNFGSSEFASLTTANGQNLNYWIMKPHNFDPSKKYPVLMYVYGGPGHNTVRNTWGGRTYLYHQYLTQKGYIVLSVDNRGTGYRGEEFKKSTYLQLGKLELEDQTAAANWFAKQPWVDASRIGIWGWSFGGYMSSLCITKSADVFKTAVAVAPVTNWRFYDNIYTERFLRRPVDNVDGYDKNSPINFVNGIKGNYLIIHGTGDDNVHFQNSVEMVNAMIKAGVKFDSEYYPNRNHGIGDKAAQYHLFRRMAEYVTEKL